MKDYVNADRSKSLTDKFESLLFNRFILKTILPYTEQ